MAGAKYGCNFERPKECALCWKKIGLGEAYCGLYAGRNAHPYFHGACLEEMAQKTREIEAERPKLEAEYNARLAAEKVEKAKAKDKAGFKKQIVKDALKAVKIKVGDLYITRGYSSGDDYWEMSREPWSKNVFAYLKFTGENLNISNMHSHYANPNYWYGHGKLNRPTYEEKTISLTDPDALKLIGEYLLTLYSRAPEPPKKQPTAQKVKI